MYSVSFFLESSLLSAKHFFISEPVSESVLCHLFFFNFWNPYQMVFTFSKQWKHEFAKYVKYAWKPINKIFSKSKIKAQEQHKWCYSFVFIVNLRCVGIDDPVEYLQWRIFCNQDVKAKIFNWVLNTPLKLWKDFTLINWLWLSWATWRFSISFMSTFIQVFPKIHFEKKKKKI